jgi:hypothetical protein
MAGNRRHESDEKQGEREPGPKVRPDPPYLPVSRQIENHRVVERDAQNTRFAQEDASGVVSDFLAPFQLAKAAIYGSKEDPQVPLAPEDHATRDRRHQLDVGGKRVHHSIDLVRLGSRSIAAYGIAHNGYGAIVFWRVQSSARPPIYPSSRNTSRACCKSGGYGLTISIRRPSAGWANASDRACSH